MGKTLDLGRLANVLTLDGSGNITVTTDIKLSSIAQDDALTQVIVRDGTTGQFKYRAVATIGNGSTIYSANGSLTANRTVTGAGYTLTFTGLGAGTTFSDNAFLVYNSDATKGFYMTGDGSIMPVALTQSLGKMGFYYWQYGTFDGGITIGNNPSTGLTGVGTGATIDWKIYNASASGAIDFLVASAATRAMRITGTGEVWMAGTSWSDAGDYKLQVEGNTYLSGNLVQVGGSTTTFGNGILFDSDGGLARIFQGNGFKMQANTSTGIQFEINNAVGFNTDAVFRLFGGGSDNTLTTGTADVMRIDGRRGFSSGTASLNALRIGGEVMNNGTFTGTLRGLYYNPAVTGTGFTHIAIETASGQIRFAGLTEDAAKTQVVVRDGTTGQLFWKTILGLPAITPTNDEGKILTVVSDVATWQDPTEVEVATYGTF